MGNLLTKAMVWRTAQCIERDEKQKSSHQYSRCSRRKLGEARYCKVGLMPLMYRSSTATGRATTVTSVDSIMDGELSHHPLDFLKNQLGNFINGKINVCRATDSNSV